LSPRRSPKRSSRHRTTSAPESENAVEGRIENIDPDFGEFMTFERLFRYPTEHFRRHLAQAPSKGEAEAAMDARKADLSREPEPVVAPPITLNTASAR
jgi:hypothetical protein